MFPDRTVWDLMRAKRGVSLFVWDSRVPLQVREISTMALSLQTHIGS